ncbi:hypothetical protein KFE98_15915 [bacterium SCSIO 12741]|nr:hypothetical protein KFE98_15915 [bacterium SCSIO 12741]
MSSGSVKYSIRCVKDEVEAYAGADQINTTDTFTFLAADSVVPPEVGSWSIASGGGGVFADIEDPASKFTGRSDSSYLLVWTVSFAQDTSRDTVRVEFTPANENWQPGKDWLDERDNQMYSTVLIGNQTWMAENLNFNSTVGNDSYYNDDSTTYAEDFGRLYNRAASMNGGRLTNATPSVVRGICPIGWHLPSRGEWDTLLTTINSSHSPGEVVQPVEAS